MPAPQPESRLPRSDATARVVSERWRALGCEVLVAVTRPQALARARAMLDVDLVALDRAASRFRPDSEVAALATAGGRRLRISALLTDLLGVALDAAARTGGDLDPTLGADLIALGYDRDLGALTLASPSDLAGARPMLALRRSVDWRAVELDRAAGMVRVPPGVVLDLGATAKARCADQSAARLADQLGCGVLVSLGGDLAVAGPAPQGGWVVRVQDVAGDPAQAAPGGAWPTCLVGLVSGGLATSSTTARRWRHAGSVAHHILDPRTGGPAADVWRSVSVAAPTCLEANVASTTAVVRGRAAVGWLTGLGLPARLVPTATRAIPAPTQPVLLGGWPTQGEAVA